ncbi:hypothetical protein BBK82_45490 [Lentzea guizhouensis]|uniref:Uncharacterized protein n=1 Tax=Lentzea guizhouensis TaxID=1586287 RepID=A0A1B2HWN1_9PSEU|nr:hypothetical protein BBK82_45490 [Lentzea guizhouensis]
MRFRDEHAERHVVQPLRHARQRPDLRTPPPDDLQVECGDQQPGHRATDHASHLQACEHERPPRRHPDVDDRAPHQRADERRRLRSPLRHRHQ